MEEEEDAQLQQFFSACESGSSTSSRTLSEGEDTTTTDVAVVKVCGDAGADCHSFQTEEGKCNAEDHHHHHDDDDDGSDEDEDEKVKRICSE